MIFASPEALNSHLRNKNNKLDTNVFYDQQNDLFSIGVLL